MSGIDRETASRLRAVIGRFAGRRVALLGDLVVDEFVHGDIDRVSREAPVLILHHRGNQLVPGGAGNAVANLRSLGAVPVPVGVVGRDDSGDRLLAWFRNAGVPTSHVLRRRSWVTPTKTRVIAGGVHTRRQQIVRIDRGAEGSVSRELREALQRRLERALRGAEGLLVADYGYGAAHPSMVRRPVSRPSADGWPVTIDSRSRVDRFRRMTACTPNHEELERVSGGRPLRTDRAVERAGRELLRRTGNGAVLVTRGARGMTLIPRRRPAVHVPAFGSDEVADVTGAGDTVIAAWTLALIAGADLLDATRLANYAAGLVVMKAGTATVSPRELRAAVREDTR